MSPDKPEHLRSEILELIQKQNLCVFVTCSERGTRARMMWFGNDQDFNFYLYTLKGAPKLESVKINDKVTLLIADPGKSLLDYSEIEVAGTAQVLCKRPEREAALALISTKGDEPRQVVNPTNFGFFDVIMIKPDIIRFRVYKDMKQGIEPTILKFPSAQP